MHHPKKVLVLSDMDGTITPENSFYDLYYYGGIVEQGESLFSQYVSGEINEEKYLKNLNILLSNSPIYEEDVKHIMNKYRVFEGFPEFLEMLRATYKDIVFAIASSGIKERVEALAKNFGIKHYSFSELEYDENGKVMGYKSFLFPEDKEQYARRLIKKTSPDFIIAIGDSYWDAPMMQHAHLRISVGNERLRANKVIYSYHELAYILKDNGHQGLWSLVLKKNN